MKTEKAAGKILTSLFLVSFLLSVATLYVSAQTGILENKIINPARNYVNDLVQSWQITPTISVFPTIHPTTTPKPTSKPTVVKSPANQTKTQPSTCYRKNIREGEFASNKCYSRSDFEDLEYYLKRFNSSVFELETQQAFIKVTCPGQSEMFKQSCEEHQKKAEAAQNDINRYREIVKGIIAKGW